MQVTIPFIEYWAHSAAAAQRGRDLHDAFSSLSGNRDNTLLWGFYPGTGETLYQTAVSLEEEGAPRFRCSCPSRQTPCKHALGLLWARVLVPERFAVETPPTGLLPPSRRKSVPRGTAKDLSRQRDGLALTLTLMRDILSRGFSESPLILSEWKALARSLSEYNLPGVSVRLLELLNSCGGAELSRNTLFLFASLYHKAKKGLHYIDRKLAEPVTDSDPELESFMGKVWYLDELSALGQTRSDARLLQLTFGRTDQPAARRYVDRAYWICLHSGEIYETCNYIPYDANGHIQPEDSCFSLVHPEQLYIYPDGMRVRWNNCQLSEPDENDYRALSFWAADSLSGIFPEVTDRLFHQPESPPVFLVRFSDIGRLNGRMVIRDSDNLALPLIESAPPVLEALTCLYNTCYHTALLRFSSHLAVGEVQGELLSLISDDCCQRLSF